MRSAWHSRATWACCGVLLGSALILCGCERRERPSGQPQAAAGSAGRAETNADPCAELADNPAFARACARLVATSELDSGNCCVARAEAGCESAYEQACVCELEPSCCAERWDARCVKLLSRSLCGSCGGRGEAGLQCGSSLCDRNWCGTEFQNQCPSEWQADVKCDCGCQFEDVECQSRAAERAP